MTDLARELGCHPTTLRAHMTRYGIAPPTQKDEPAPQRAPAARNRHAKPEPDTATLTGRLLATKGRYEALEAIRKAEGWTPAQAMQRFHAARAGA